MTTEPQTAPQEMTTAGLQAKVRLRQTWFEAHPNQPMPEGRKQVDALIEAIEREARSGLDAALRKALDDMDNETMPPRPTQYETTMPPRPTQYRRGWAAGNARCAELLRAALAGEAAPTTCGECAMYSGTDEAPPPHDHPDGGEAAPVDGLPEVEPYDAFLAREEADDGRS